MPGGGDMMKKDVMGYQPPAGPRHIMNTGVGLRGGDNCGKAGSQGAESCSPKTGGTPGQLNTRVYPCGSQ